MEYKSKSSPAKKSNSTHLFAIDELTKFINSFLLNFFNLSVKERCVDISFILRKLEYPVDITSDFQKDINSIAENGMIEFLIVLLSDKNINYNDNGDLISTVFNLKLKRRCYQPNLDKIERELINLLLYKNSNFYANNETIANHIFSDKEYIKNFVDNLTDIPNQSVITMLSTRIRGVEFYTEKIKIEWLENLSIETIYDVIKGAYISMRHDLCKKNKTLTKIQKLIDIIDYLFNTYQIKDIPIDIIIQCFFETDDGIFREELNKEDLKVKLFKIQITKLISRIESITHFEKFDRLFCMLIHTSCNENIYSLIKDISTDWIKKLFLESLNNIRYAPIVFDFLINYYPKFRFEKSDIYEIVSVQEKLQNCYAKSSIIKPFRGFLDLIDNPFILIPFYFINKILQFEWDDVLMLLSEKSVNGNITILCSTQEAELIINKMKNVIKKNTFSYIKEIIFKECNIIFIDIYLFQIIHSIFEINCCPKDISNYVNFLVHTCS